MYHVWQTFVRPVARSGAVLLVLLLAGGCTTYSTKMANLRPQLTAGDYEGALLTVEEEAGKKDQLLLYLERGLILHYADRHGESNEAFAAAERMADDLYTKSVSEGAASLISNDNAISYRARPFEMAMVPYYKALNYIYLGDRDAAQVEARRAGLQLRKYVAATLKGIRDEDADDLLRTGNNAFLHYFSGMLYDWDGEINDAYVSYRNAATAFQLNHGLLALDIPPSLAADLARLANRLGFQTELAELRKQCPAVFEHEDGARIDHSPSTPAQYESGVANAGWQSGHGEVALFLETGYVARKTEIRFDFPIFEGEAYNDPNYWSWQIYAGMGNMQALVHGRKIEYWVSVAAPELQDAPGPITGVRVAAHMVDEQPADVQVASARISTLSREARVTFDAEKASIFFKTILRGLTKYLASRGAEKAGGGWAKLAANIFGAVTESADTRSWLTLPENLELVRMSLPAGVYDLEVDILGPRGQILMTRTVPGVDVRAGDWTFLSRRVF